MDFTINKTAQIMEKALDGLSARHKAISANITNAQTSDYTRSDVYFEDQLQNIISQERIKEGLRVNNSNMPLTVNHGMIDTVLNSNSFSGFSPESVLDTNSPVITNGNNVNLETEMIELAKNASRYNVLAQLETSYFKSLETQLKSGNNL